LSKVVKVLDAALRDIGGWVCICPTWTIF
jgi:hypothetical protein